MSDELLFDSKRLKRLNKTKYTKWTLDDYEIVHDFIMQMGWSPDFIMQMGHWSPVRKSTACLTTYRNPKTGRTWFIDRVLKYFCKNK